ncbi:uncharacterized protein LOC103573715 [Microplitis demolitor]|uniref:uncharacterized protein LOC103573715 n=1 Tax=Microplitis demolitor TaxID=69319 RepID=UPI0004CD5878|nr:uncharacterized protein LOC103573715 [Microplitis demolitor]
MVSSITSIYDVDFFNNLYDNICLIADKTWAFNKEDNYRKLNQRLWVQNFKWIEKYHDKNLQRRVRDVIPDSLLAQYGNYEYNEARENLYKSSQETSIFHCENLHSTSEPTEPWMLDDVEKIFTHIMTKDENNIKFAKNNNDDYYYDKCCPLLYTIENAAELELQMRIANDNVKCVWKPTKTIMQIASNREQVTQGYDCSRANQHQQLHDNDHKQLPSERCVNDDESCINSLRYPTCSFSSEIISKNRYEEKDYKVFQKSSLPLLSPEVPEFFPKEMVVGPTRLDIRYESSVPIHYIPLSSSSAERNYYHDKLLPVSRPQLSNFNAIFQNPGIQLVTPPIMTPLIRSPHQWIPRIAPPLQIQIPVCCSIVPHQSITSLQSICPINHHRPIQFNEKIVPIASSSNQFSSPSAIPVYQQPPELYHHDYKRKSQGVDFNNLILLTKNAMKVRRNQSKNPQQSSSFILESRQPNLKSEDDVLQWLNMGYPKRAKEFVNINSLVTDIQQFIVKSDSDDITDNDTNLSEYDENDESATRNQTEDTEL